jgi:TP901 family phage tail tape measure protein
MSDTMRLEAIFDLVDKSSRTLNKIERNLKKADTATKKLTRSEKKLEKQSKKTAGIMSKSFSKIASVMGGLAVGGTIVAGMKKGIELADQFQQGMAEVATLTDMSADQVIKSYGKIVESTQETFGKNQQDVIKTLYDAFSAGVPQTQKAASEFMKAAGKIAVGGVASLKDAGDAITTIQNAWSAFDKTITAENVANAMFGAVKAGKTTVRELAPSLGQIAPLAATAGLSIEETFASIAQITKVGVPTSEAITQVNSAISGLLAPTDQADKLLKKFGITNIKGKIQSQGFVTVLNEMRKKVKAVTKNESEEFGMLQKLLGRKEALKATLALTNIEQSEFSRILKETARNGGQVNAATAKMQTRALENAQAQEKWNNALKKFGEALAPLKNEYMKFGSGVLDNLAEIINKWDYIKKLEKKETPKPFTLKGGVESLVNFFKEPKEKKEKAENFQRSELFNRKVQSAYNENIQFDVNVHVAGAQSSFDKQLAGNIVDAFSPIFMKKKENISERRNLRQGVKK